MSKYLNIYPGNWVNDIAFTNAETPSRTVVSCMWAWYGVYFIDDSYETYTFGHICGIHKRKMPTVIYGIQAGEIYLSLDHPHNGARPSIISVWIHWVSFSCPHLAAEKCTVLLSLLMYRACIWFLHHYTQGATGLHATALWIQGRWQNYCTIILPFINLIPTYTYLFQHCRVWLHGPVWEYGDSCNSCRPR